MKILMVLTSHDQLGNTGKKTGFWLEEFAAPYFAFKDAGAEITLVSQRAASLRWIRRAMSRMHRPPRLIVSAMTLLLSRHWPLPVAWPMSALMTLMRCSTQAVMARCGTWQKTSIPSR